MTERSGLDPEGQRDQPQDLRYQVAQLMQELDEQSRKEGTPYDEAEFKRRLRELLGSE